ncbi:hypothetical protein AOQ84DRAFT_13417 [Glonium stellatum]|uniref:Uncharacterized protein n=1 Tax=Glonium stellatum TaxID=574774 RepID=A0A8E2EM88_9PEZI|nr:hypothetical protein AOQ84DRAFT_13417 [Glonium stellatum]
MAWARHPIPQPRLHGVDSQATPVPHPAGPAHHVRLRVVLFLAIFPKVEQGQRLSALSLRSRTTAAVWQKDLRSPPPADGPDAQRCDSCAAILPAHPPNCSFQFCFSLHLCAWQCQHVLRASPIASSCERHGWGRAFHAHESGHNPLWHRRRFRKASRLRVCGQERLAGIFRNRPLAPGVHLVFAQLLSARPHTGKRKTAAPRAISLDSRAK